MFSLFTKLKYTLTKMRNIIPDKIPVNRGFKSNMTSELKIVPGTSESLFCEFLVANSSFTVDYWFKLAYDKKMNFNSIRLSNSKLQILLGIGFSSYLVCVIQNTKISQVTLPHALLALRGAFIIPMAFTVHFTFNLSLDTLTTTASFINITGIFD